MPRRRKGWKAVRPLVRLQGAKPEHADWAQQVDVRSCEEFSPSGSTPLTGREKYTVEYHLYQVYPTDTENPYTKALTDQLRYHGIIPDDNPYAVRVMIHLHKVSHMTDEGTKIVIRQNYE